MCFSVPPAHHRSAAPHLTAPPQTSPSSEAFPRGSPVSSPAPPVHPCLPPSTKRPWPPRLPLPHPPDKKLKIPESPRFFIFIFKHLFSGSPFPSGSPAGGRAGSPLPVTAGTAQRPGRGPPASASPSRPPEVSPAAGAPPAGASPPLPSGQALPPRPLPAPLPPRARPRTAPVRPAARAAPRSAAALGPGYPWGERRCHEPGREPDRGQRRARAAGLLHGGSAAVGAASPRGAIRHLPSPSGLLRRMATAAAPTQLEAGGYRWRRGLPSAPPAAPRIVTVSPSPLAPPQSSTTWSPGSCSPDPARNPPRWAGSRGLRPGRGGRGRDRDGDGDGTGRGRRAAGGGAAALRAPDSRPLCVCPSLPRCWWRSWRSTRWGACPGGTGEALGTGGRCGESGVALPRLTRPISSRGSGRPCGRAREPRGRGQRRRGSSPGRAGTGGGSPRPPGAGRGLTAASLPVPPPRLPPAADPPAPGLAGQGAPPELRGPGEPSFTPDFPDKFPPPAAAAAPRHPPPVLPRSLPGLRAAPRWGRGCRRAAGRAGGRRGRAGGGTHTPGRRRGLLGADWRGRAIVGPGGLSEGTYRGPARRMAPRLTSRRAAAGDERRQLIGCGAAEELAGRAGGAGCRFSPRRGPRPAGLTGPRGWQGRGGGLSVAKTQRSAGTRGLEEAAGSGVLSPGGPGGRRAARRPGQAERSGGITCRRAGGPVARQSCRSGSGIPGLRRQPVLKPCSSPGRLGLLEN